MSSEPLNTAEPVAKKPSSILTTLTPHSSLAVWAFPLCMIAFFFCTELLGDWGRQWLSYDRVLIGQGEWWRWVSGNFVHLGWYHWVLNMLGIVVLVLLCPERLSPLVWTRRVLLLSVGMSAGLYIFVPSLRSYVGMSGVIHGLFVLGLMPQVMKKDLIALGCVLYLVGKILYELYAGAPVSDEQAIGGSVVVESHFFGSLSAFIYGFIFNTYTRVETWRRTG